MCFVTAGMGGGTGTGAAPVVAQAARNKGILTVGVVTKPFHFEGGRRMRLAESGIEELQKSVDTLIVIPNQNLFRIANDKTTFADAFAMADQVLYSGVACITDLMVKEGLINLDFADVRSVMREMGRAMMGTGEASGQGRALQAAEAAIANPLLDETSMKGAQGLLISITGGRDLTLFEVDEAATRIREEVDPDANIILGATFDELLEGIIRVSVVATGIDRAMNEAAEQDLPAGRQAGYPSLRGRCSGTGRSSACASHAGTEAGRSDRADHPHGGSRDGTRARDPGSARSSAGPAAGCSAGNLPSAEQASSRLLRKLRQLASGSACSSAPAPVMSQPAPAAAGHAAADRPAVRHAAGPHAEGRGLPAGRPGRDSTTARSRPPRMHMKSAARWACSKRITNSLGRREEDAVAADMTAAPPAASQQRRPLSPEASLYAPRRGNLDDQGRAVPQARMLQEDDQLEIPAFLRRQSN